LGFARPEAEASIKKFRSIDERALLAQMEIKDDEQKLIQSAQMVAKELDRLFEADTQSDEREPAPTLAQPMT
jgi:hypothetical protein